MPAPVITVTRQYASGGAALAREVAEALGWTVIDNQFVDEVARRAGLPPAEVAGREERAPGLLERLARTLAVASPEMFITSAGGAARRARRGRARPAHRTSHRGGGGARAGGARGPGSAGATGAAARCPARLRGGVASVAHPPRGGAVGGPTRRGGAGRGRHRPATRPLCEDLLRAPPPRRRELRPGREHRAARQWR
jgi:hypothetical protein